MVSAAKHDFHIHSCFSPDCETSINDIIETARSKGLSSICLTDHYDMDYPETPDFIVFEIDIERYLKELTAVKKQLEDSNDPLRLLVGLEQGVMPSTCDKLSNYSKEHPGLDFIICSSHVVCGMDPYYPECWKYPDGTYKDEMKIYQTYFEDILYNVTHFNDYDVYGHIDYIFRYGPDDRDDFEKVTDSIFKEKYFSKYKDIIHEILKNIIESGKGIEINTGSLYRGMDYAHPHFEILKLYKELGGEILTIGSDAHDTEHIGYGYEDGVLLAKKAGFRYLTTYKDRKPDFYPI